MKKNPLHVSFMEEWERSSDEERRKVLEYMRKQHNTEAKGTDDLHRGKKINGKNWNIIMQNT